MLLRRAVIASILFTGVARAQGSSYVVKASSETAEYADTDHVFVTTPSVSGSVARPTTGLSVNGSYLVDVVSAASVDIVSTASRSWQEVRQAGTLEATYKPGTFGVTASGALSTSPTTSRARLGSSSRRTSSRRTSRCSPATATRHDIAGRTGTPFSVYSHTFDTDSIKAGVTFLIDRATTGHALVDAQFLSGDSAETYRYIPLFAPGTNVPLGASIDTVNALRLSARASEQVPLSRNRYALTLRLAHRFHTSTLRLEERLYDDTWGLLAQSADGWWLANLGKRIELGPHLRLHDQAGVDFWERGYVLRSGFNFPAYRTGDRELGPLVNFTGGGLLRCGVGPKSAPMKWALALDVETTYSRYLDDLYLTDRTAVLGALSIAGEL